VILSSERWAHIVDAHPELAPHLDDVLRAVEEPTEILAGHRPDEAHDRVLVGGQHVDEAVSGGPGGYLDGVDAGSGPVPVRDDLAASHVVPADRAVTGVLLGQQPLPSLVELLLVGSEFVGAVQVPSAGRSTRRISASAAGRYGDLADAFGRVYVAQANYLQASNSFLKAARLAEMNLALDRYNRLAVEVAAEGEQVGVVSCP
jgi:hypothetical protein